MTTTVHTINDDATGLGEKLGELVDRLADALREGTHTAQDVRHIRATLAGVMSDRTDLRATLDGLDVDDLIIGTDAADTIRLWGWVAALRRALAAVARRAVEADTVAAALEAGVDQVIHVVRSGETLQSIAATYLGTWKAWTRIADANGLAPGQPTAGTVLIIPARR